jgi:hypothetical protein
LGEDLHPKPTRGLANKRRDLAPDFEAAFHKFSQAAFQVSDAH